MARYAGILAAYTGYVVIGSVGLLDRLPDLLGVSLFAATGVATGFAVARWWAVWMAVVWPLVNLFVNSDDAPAWLLALLGSMPAAAVVIAAGVVLSRTRSA